MLNNNNIPREINSNISNNFPKQTYSNHVPLHLYHDKQTVTNNNWAVKQKIERILPIPTELKKGDRLGPNQRFSVIKIITAPRSGFSVVVKCSDTLRNCDVAIKIIKKCSHAQREINNLTRLENNLPGIIGFLEWFDYQYINSNNEYVKLKALVLEFCLQDMHDYVLNFFSEYQSLVQQLTKLENELQISFDKNKSFEKKKTNAKLNDICKSHTSRVQKWFSHIVEGVLMIHSFGIAHCDLSLENILINGSEDAKIADFGLAVDVSSIQQLQTLSKNGYQHPSQSIGLSRMSRQLIQVQERLGKNYYMSPQMYNCQCNPFMNDIWSLGIILFIMLCGTPPYKIPDKTNLSFRRFIYRDNSYFNPNELFKAHPRTFQFFSHDIKDLLNQIFQEKEQNRISIEKIWEHPYVIEGKRLRNKTNNCTQNISSPLSHDYFSTSNDNLYSSQFFPLNSNNMILTNMGVNNTLVPIKACEQQSLQLPVARSNQYNYCMNRQILPYIMSPSFSTTPFYDDYFHLTNSFQSNNNYFSTQNLRKHYCSQYQ